VGYRILHKTDELTQLTEKIKIKTTEIFNNKKLNILKLSALKAIETFKF